MTTMGRLTTHVLDTSLGNPAAGLALRLYRLNGAERDLLKEAVTNDDGRVDGPVLEGADFSVGSYELEFEAGAYFDVLGIELPKQKFLDVVVLRFGISAADEHYHVPLLLSPFGYSTYRGS
ncbi:MAG: hydroxyisourate hydrolase [Hyphomicrobiales bacterium]